MVGTLKTSTLLTWGLILYGMYKGSPAAAAAEAQAQALASGQCNYGPMATTLQQPIWMRQLAENAPNTFTLEGEQ